MADRWWLVAGLRNVGRGNFEPDPGEGVPLALCSEAVRLTSLLGGRGGGVLSENIGVVEPVRDRVWEPEVYAADPGRDTLGVLLESRDVDMPVERRRNQVVRGPLVFEETFFPPLSSCPCKDRSTSASTSKLAPGVKLLCLFCDAARLLLAAWLSPSLA